jgi:hypothetical protein
VELPVKASARHWKHVGGGCLIASKSPYSCDDEYRHDESGRLMKCKTTPERHVAMPKRVTGPAELRALMGITNIRVMKGARP